jgi:TfoX/Sxy family transcriptional regulator of competence genes
MAYDEGHAQVLRKALQDQDGITEKRMFGGLCFLLNGNMLCGAHKDGGMFRVGKDNEVAALAIAGARPLGFTGRPMGGMIDVDEEAFADADRIARWRDLALDFVAALPSKE